MSYPKKPGGAACHTVQVDAETFNLIEQFREKSESKGETIKRFLVKPKITVEKLTWVLIENQDNNFENTAKIILGLL